MIDECQVPDCDYDMSWGISEEDVKKHLSSHTHEELVNGYINIMDKYKILEDSYWDIVG